jgi:hypothetical protein
VDEDEIFVGLYPQPVKLIVAFCCGTDFGADDSAALVDYFL